MFDADLEEIVYLFQSHEELPYVELDISEDSDQSSRWWAVCSKEEDTNGFDELWWQQAAEKKMIRKYLRENN